MEQAPGPSAATLDDAVNIMTSLRDDYVRGLMQIEALKNEVAARLASSAPHPSSSSVTLLPSGCKAQPPTTFSGKRDADLIENWLFSCEQYFVITGLQDASRQVQYAGTLLRGPALVWLRTMCSAQEMVQLISTWVGFCRELKANFCPSNLVKLARDRVAYMRQTSASVRDYIREFRAVCLDIPLMAADEKLDRFVRGLKQPMRRDVELKEHTTFDEAVKLSERLDSAQRSASSGGSSSYQGRQSRRYDAADGPTPMDLNDVPHRSTPRPSGQHQRPGNRPQSPGRPQFTRLTPDLRAKLMAEGKCLYCREPGHFVDNCPKRSGSGNGRRPPTPGQRR